MLQNEIIDSFSANVEKRLLQLNKISSPGAQPVSEDVVLESLESTSGEDISEIFPKILESAAFCGWFEPELFVADFYEDVQKQVLNELAPYCIIDTSGKKTQWFLKEQSRVDIFKRLIAEGRLKEVSNIPARSNDQYAQLLHELLEKGKEINVAGKSQEGLIILISILETLDSMHEIPKPDVNEVRKYLKQAKYLSEYELLTTNFVGRKEELEKLRAFVFDPTNYYTWRGLILTGLGGAGKSTLLAKFAFDLVHNINNPLTVIVLDFDKPGMDPTDTQWLEAEMANQVAAQYPALREPLQKAKEASAKIRRRRRLTKYNVQSEISSVERGSRDHVLGTLSRVLPKGDPGTTPLVLMLDTYEEVVQREVSEKLMFWLDEVHDMLNDFNIRVIFSGRLFDDAVESLRNTQKVEKPIEVNEFDQEMTIAFLQKEQLPEEMVWQVALSEFLPRRPLELKLLTKALLSGDITIGELEKEMKSGGVNAMTLFLGLVHKRVIQRIADPVVRSLAFPGFVLRYLTAELIQKVLVPALDLPYMDEEDAETAITALASYTWLTTRTNTSQLWHRRDLRRSMLKLMIASHPIDAKKIHEAAILFFNERESAENKAESIYHRLMMVEKPSDGEEFELGELSDAYSFIGPDIADLPDPARILLRYANNLPVAMDEIECLPNRHLESAYYKTGHELTGSREFGKALKLLIRGKEAGIAFKEVNSSMEFNWEKEVAFATVSWKEMDQSFPSRTEPLRALYETLFYKAITDPRTVSLAALREIIKRVSDEPPTASFIAQRILFCLICIIDRVKSDDVLYQEVLALREKFSIETNEPGRQRNLMLLNIADAGRSVQTNLPPSRNLTLHGIKLNVLWLTELNGQLAKSGLLTAELSQKIDTIKKLLSDPITSLRNVLSNIDSTILEPVAVAVVPGWGRTLTKQVIDIVRGPDPEFRDPCRFALLEVFTDTTLRKNLAWIISDVTGFQLPELEPKRFANAMRADPERFLEVYIEFADRTWNLGTLMKRALEIKPDAPKLRMVYSAYWHWDERVRNILEKKL